MLSQPCYKVVVQVVTLLPCDNLLTTYWQFHKLTIHKVVTRLSQGCQQACHNLVTRWSFLYGSSSDYGRLLGRCTAPRLDHISTLGTHTDPFLLGKLVALVIDIPITTFSMPLGKIVS